MVEQHARTPGVVHVIGVVWVCLLLLWAIVLPTLDGPDEAASLDLVTDAVDTSPLTWQQPFTDPTDDRLLAAAAQVSGEQGLAITREVGTWRDLRAPAATIDVLAQTGNSRSADPPLGYRLLGYGLALTPDWQTIPVDRIVLAMRLLSLLAVAPLPWLLARIATVLNGRESVITASAAGVFTMPRLAIQGTTVGTGALLVLLSAIVLLVLARLAVGEGGVRQQRLAGVGILLAGLVHPWGMALLVALAGAVLVRRRAGAPTSDLVEIAGGVLLPVLALGWWYGVNATQFGAVQPAVGATGGPGGAAADVIVGVWGQAGAMLPGDDMAAADVPIVLAGAFSLLLLIAAGAAVRGRGIGAALLLGGPAAGGLAMAVALRPAALLRPAADGPLRAGEDLAGLGGEALLVGLPGLLVLVAVGLQRGLPPRLQPWSWAPALLIAVGLHGLLLGQLLTRRWAAGDVSLSDGLLRIIGRSPLGVEVIAGVLLGLLFGLFVLVVTLAGRSRRLVIVNAADS